MNQRDIGKLFGMTSHQVGKHLKDLGLRSQVGSPSKMAREQGIAVPGGDFNGHPEHLWHVEAVVGLFEEAGHRRVPNPPPNLATPPVLIGPFSLHETDNDTWQVVGSNNNVGIVVTGQRNAELIRKMMNGAHTIGMLDAQNV